MQITRSFKNNIYTQLLLRILIVYILFTLTRIAFYLFNLDLFAGIEFSHLAYIMYGGLKFDTTAILYLNMLFVVLSILPFNFIFNKVYKKVIKYFFVTINSVALFANCSDIIYYRFTNKRTTSTVFAEFAHEKNIGGLFTHFIVDYWYVTLLLIVLIYLLVKLYSKTEFKVITLFTNKIVHYLASTVIIVVLCLLSIAGMRGGFTRTTRPITLSNAGKFVDKPSQMAIVLNTPFAIIRTIGKKDFKRMHYYKSEESLDSIFDPVFRVDKSNKFINKNVVIFVLESCAREHSKLCNEKLFHLKNYRGYMPFLDSLMMHSRTFVNAYANGHKSIDALPSVTTSIPRISNIPFVLSHRSNNKTNSLAYLLNKKGYNTSFFVGHPNGGMGYESLMKLAGFKDYYGKTEYNNDDDYDGFWGIWDHKFFQFFAKTLNTIKQPFLTAIFSITSHHPFVVPAEFKGKFKEGDVPLQKCISYTDYSIKKFFETAKKMPWYKNTLFVFTADHTSQKAHDFYRTDLQSCAVPLFFFCPSDTSLVGIDYNLAQHADVLPTIMGYLNYDEDFVSFGNNLLDTTAERFVINNSSNCYQFAMGDYVILFNGKKTITMYNYKTDLLNKKNLVGKLPEIQDKMEKKVKAIIQQYNNRMLDNRLVVE